jgi:hypothetical protein
MQVAKAIEPSTYILSVLTQQERLEIALEIAEEAFKHSKLHLEDIETAVRHIRKRLYKGGKKTKRSS